MGEEWFVLSCHASVCAIKYMSFGSDRKYDMNYNHLHNNYTVSLGQSSVTFHHVPPLCCTTWWTQLHSWYEYFCPVLLTMTMCSFFMSWLPYSLMLFTIFNMCCVACFSWQCHLYMYCTWPLTWFQLPERLNSTLCQQQQQVLIKVKCVHHYLCEY